MSYTKRKNGRGFDEARPMKAHVGVVKRADGSAVFQIGDTIALAAVYGPRELHPRFLQNPRKGVLRCIYDMMSFSVPERKRPGPTRRSTEISLVTKNALQPALNLDEFPNTVTDVFIEIIQADSGTRCAGIIAASMALADAGLPMRDLVAAVSVGKVGDKVLVDLDGDEESYEEGSTDIPVAIMPRTGEITLLQLDGDISKDDFKKALSLAQKTCLEIYKVQQKALKDKYKEGGLDA